MDRVTNNMSSEKEIADLISKSLNEGNFETIEVFPTEPQDSLSDLTEEDLSKPFVQHIIEPIYEVLTSTQHYDGAFAFIEAFQPTDLMPAARKGAAKAICICNAILGVELHDDSIEALETIFGEYDEYANELQVVWDTLNEIINEGFFEGVFRNLRSTELKRLRGVDKLLEFSSGGFFGAMLGGVYSQYKRTKWEIEVLEYYAEHINRFPEELWEDITKRFYPYIERDVDLAD